MARPKNPSPSTAEAYRRRTVFQCKLRELRIKRGMYAHEVGQELGISASFMSEIESGRSLSLERALSIARYFGVTVNDIWSPVETTNA